MSSAHCLWRRIEFIVCGLCCVCCDCFCRLPPSSSSWDRANKPQRPPVRPGSGDDTNNNGAMFSSTMVLLSNHHHYCHSTLRTWLYCNDKQGPRREISAQLSAAPLGRTKQSQCRGPGQDAQGGSARTLPVQTCRRRLLLLQLPVPLPPRQVVGVSGYGMLWSGESCRT